MSEEAPSTSDSLTSQADAISMLEGDAYLLQLEHYDTILSCSAECVLLIISSQLYDHMMCASKGLRSCWGPSGSCMPTLSMHMRLSTLIILKDLQSGAERFVTLKLYFVHVFDETEDCYAQGART